MKKEHYFFIAGAILIILIAGFILIRNQSHSPTESFSINKNIDIAQLASMRSNLQDNKLMLAAFQKLSETDRGQAVLDKINEYMSKVNSSNEELNQYLQQNNVPEELSAELETIDSSALTWSANYNPIFLKNDKTKRAINGFKTIKSSGSSIAGNSIRENIKERIISRVNNTQTSSEFSQFPKLEGIMAQIKASRGASSVNTSDITQYVVIVDWRNKSGMNFMTPVKNQGDCGSCWAFASSAVFEAQVKINANNPITNPDLSEQDLVSCYLPNAYSENGCDGATTSQIQNLFANYMKSTGESNEGCLEYQASGSIGCSEKCSNWQTEVTKIGSYKSLSLNNVQEIKDYISSNGPVLTAMNIYRDFYSYESGIYQHTTNQLEGGHAVAIIGYGEYKGRTFWIVKNSWGDDWGEDGYFRIFSGDSNIESFILLGAKN